MESELTKNNNNNKNFERINSENNKTIFRAINDNKPKNKRLHHFEEKANSRKINSPPYIIKEIFNENHFLKQYFDYKEIEHKKQEKIKGYIIKSHCPFCKKVLTENEKNKEEKDKNIINISNNYYRNKNFKDIRSCFMYSVNNFPLINKNIYLNKKFSKERIFYEGNEKYNRTQKSWNKKINMESELTKKNKLIKFKEIQRKEIDPTNLYTIDKPLIPSIRGRFFKNTRKRFEKPKRMVFLNDGEFDPYDDVILISEK
jgi:thiol-disulfide isomerase/thioredoxin